MSTEVEAHEIIVELDGITIRANSLYQITNKPDPDAPTGYVEAGTTKLPSQGIADTVSCRFKETNPNSSSGEGLFDTGLYVESPQYATKDIDEVEETVKKLRKFIVAPYERLHGKLKLDQGNKDFWDGYGIHLYDRRMFNTNNATDLLDLFIAISGGDLTPVGKEGSPAYKYSQYMIVDNEEVRTVKESRANIFIDAITNFGLLLGKNKTLLVALLRYLGITGVSTDSSENTLKPAFRDWVESEHANGELFMDYFEKAKTDEGRDEFLTFSKLFDLVMKNKVKRDSVGHYEYMGVTLGTDLKGSAKNLAKNKDLQDIKIQLLEIEI